VRRLTEYATTPNTPLVASSSASMAKKPMSMALNRREPSDAA
jgi:hypothetical protein